MPENWYYIGPDKTGLNCPNCCNAFSISGGSCQPKSCQLSGSLVIRNYLCPNPTFPTPFHYYKITPSTGNASIAPNPRFCSTVSPSCYTYTPSVGLNAAGRIGSSCSSQEYVSAVNNCDASQRTCTSEDIVCDTSCGYAPGGIIFYPKRCEPNPLGVCSCVSSSSYSECDCLCVAGPFNGLCYQNTDSTGSCYVDPGQEDCIYCDDGTLACDGAPCCNNSPLPDPPCTACEKIVCGGDFYYCAPKSCDPDCSDGYECSCGTCVCNTSSTCCKGYSYGWSYNSAARQCRSCGYGYNSTQNGCCDSAWKRKSCDAGSICCNDGRCYDEATTLCTIS